MGKALSYSMTRVIRRTGQDWAREGAAWPTVEALEKRGLIEARTVNHGTAKETRLTPHGAAYLADLEQRLGLKKSRS